MCVWNKHACAGVMRTCVFNGNASTRARVNAENHNNPTGLATIVLKSKEKVSRRKAPPWWMYSAECYTSTIDGPRCVMTYHAGRWAR
jgi:hypothetical protein